ncbi:hypothetical protein IV203_029336 [Nitzschia inconspicua]|uniref:Uncharacterized protein n=1 Tax=Nitzschia inconspicua TaxID=303405 RepID=A0A9K3L820_9STRA|nr:hypothetical protein IV203_032328 [Nitzschia inconspicua]KAG7346962.1 hypothetical protein IV203_006031 [Nitzschia inconspicua]KAG7356481.1 hypothetical protein IV203_001167 [Nitzschia inconspicua]KAG7359716.1 hypothetical protein IV203_034814 [Nitzschia inconspicua]KAG7366666.1 hypothetical protein IV203_029336 [Nitzschia inconspicua]
MTPDPMKAIPAELKAFQDGWEEITDDSQPYEVVMEDDFSQEYSAKRIRFNVSNDVAFAESMKNATSHNITLMERDRFIAIQSCTRGYAQAGRTASVESNAWMQQGALLRKMKEIEVALFARSVDVLLHIESGFIVLDDELIASRAADVESKVVSNRKRGKEGPVADCVACSMLSTCLGMRLRVKNDSSNVARLLDSLCIPTNAKCGIELAFDRGYGKLPAVLAAAERNLDVITIAGTLGSRHPFNTVEEWNAAVQRRAHNPEEIRNWELQCSRWLLAKDKFLGCEVRVAKRQKPDSQRGIKWMRTT